MDNGPEDHANILIVDDQEEIRGLLSRLLDGFDYRTAAAGNAEEAMAQLSRSSFEAAIVDIQMPGTNGIQLLRELKSLSPDIAVVMMSGVREIETALTALKLGAYDYITKPFNRDLVHGCLKRALEKRSLVIQGRLYQANLEKQVQERTRELENALHKIEFTYDATIKALGAALDLRDSETENHSLRVASFVLKLAETIGIDDGEALRDIEWGAYLHDIGKIGIPDGILMKPGKLSSEEKEIIKGHPVLGYNLLNRIQ